MMRISNLRRGVAAVTGTRSRNMHRLPNIPGEEQINWGKELYVGFIKVLFVATIGTAATNYIGKYLEDSAKASEAKQDAFYRAKFAAEAAAAAHKQEHNDNKHHH